MNKRAFTIAVTLALLLIALLSTGRSSAQGVSEPPGSTTLISSSPAGEPGNEHSEFATISANGQVIAFHSKASNLAGDDPNGARDVFLYTGADAPLRLISRTAAGQSGNADSAFPDLSTDGRFVAFHSLASDLVAGDDNNELDVFVYDDLTGEIERISESPAGEDGNGLSFFPEISADGRYVVFYSLASNLVEQDENDTWDVFVHDRETGLTTLVSISSNGEQGNGPSSFPEISADGRYVAFGSLASNLVPGDSNNLADIFVHDRVTHVTERITLGPAGEEANGPSLYPVLSGDGRYVTFGSQASNLVPGDSNGVQDVFVYDRLAGIMERVSVSTAGAQSNGASFYPTLSDDGRYVAFDSAADNLVAGDTNGVRDVFRHDRLTGATVRISLGAAGQQADGESSDVALSADGWTAVFQSLAGNLAAKDGNDLKDIYLRILIGDALYFPAVWHGVTAD